MCGSYGMQHTQLLCKAPPLLDHLYSKGKNHCARGSFFFATTRPLIKTLVPLDMFTQKLRCDKCNSSKAQLLHSCERWIQICISTFCSSTKWKLLGVKNCLNHNFWSCCNTYMSQKLLKATMNALQKADTRHICRPRTNVFCWCDVNFTSFF